MQDVTAQIKQYLDNYLDIKLGFGLGLQGQTANTKHEDTNTDQSPVIKQEHKLNDKDYITTRKSARHQSKVDYTPFL